MFHEQIDALKLSVIEMESDVVELQGQIKAIKAKIAKANKAIKTLETLDADVTPQEDVISD